MSLELGTKEVVEVGADLPDAQYRNLKGGDTFTAPGPGLVVFFPAPAAWGANSDGKQSMFGKLYGPLKGANGQSVCAGGEPLFASMSIYRKLKAEKGKGSANGNSSNGQQQKSEG